MKEHHITVQRTARYYTLGSLNAQTQRVWIVAHGFGQMAASFLKNFEDMISEHDFFVAPEALNRFYSKGSSGTVGATWMTREDRMNEIQDYCHYLDSLYHALGLDAFKGEIIVLGFSQGSSTITRWVDSTLCRVSKTVVYAGEVGAEVFPLKESSGLKRTQNYFIYGTKDEFFNQATFDMMIERYKPLNAEVISYDGNHSVNASVLLQVVK